MGAWGPLWRGGAAGMTETRGARYPFSHDV